MRISSDGLRDSNPGLLHAMRIRSVDPSPAQSNGEQPTCKNRSAHGLLGLRCSRGITVAVTSSNTASSQGAVPQACGQYRTNSSMPISLKRPTISWKYSTDSQGVSGGKQTRECLMEAGSLSTATHRSSNRWLRSAVTA